MERQIIGLMGGSFDPIHLGHVQLATLAYEQANLDRVLFLVSGNPPHKRSLGASAQQRLDMVSLALEGLCWAQASDVELRDGTVYTLDTLHILHTQLPQADYRYIIGSDTLLDLKNWYHFPEVAGLCGFLCVLRSGVDREAVIAESERLTLTCGADIRFLCGQPDGISSTFVRERLHARLSTEGLLLSSVRDYIDKHGLYGKETSQS